MVRLANYHSIQGLKTFQMDAQTCLTMNSISYVILPLEPYFTRHLRSSHLANFSDGVSTSRVNMSATQIVTAKVIIVANTKPISFLVEVS